MRSFMPALVAGWDAKEISFSTPYGIPTRQALPGFPTFTFGFLVESESSPGQMAINVLTVANDTNGAPLRKEFSKSHLWGLTPSRVITVTVMASWDSPEFPVPRMVSQEVGRIPLPGRDKDGASMGFQSVSIRRDLPNFWIIPILIRLAETGQTISLVNR